MPCVPTKYSVIFHLKIWMNNCNYLCNLVIDYCCDLFSSKVNLLGRCFYILGFSQILTENLPKYVYILNHFYKNGPNIMHSRDR